MIWEKEKLKIDTNTKHFIKNMIFGNKDIDISIREVFLILEEWVNKDSRSDRDVRREIYILNRKAEGMTFREIGEKIGVTGNRVRQILLSIRRRLIFTTTKRRITIKDKK